MKRKKFLALLLASAMAFSMAACGNDTPADSSAPSGSESGDASSEENSDANSDASSEENESGNSSDAGGSDVAYENKVIMGNTTDLTGDFRFPGWGTSSVGASDQDIGRLTIG